MPYNFVFSCYGCNTKHAGCHAECETYKRERIIYEQKKAEYDKYREAEYYLNNANANRRDRAAKARKETQGYRRFRSG